MRTLPILIASLLAVLALGCNTVDPDECWVNTSGGFGGGGTIPIGSGVGATSSGDFLAPPKGPLADDAADNPCIADETNSGNNGSPCADTGTVADGTYTYCSGQCADRCPSGGVYGFSPSIFKFVTIVADDGTGEAGGWQEATGTMNFFRWTSLLPERWSCTVIVSMPLRTAVNGKISAQAAASLSAEVATQASFTVMKIEPEIPPGIYCIELKKEMSALFAKPALKTYGVSVK